MNVKRIFACSAALLMAVSANAVRLPVSVSAADAVSVHNPVIWADVPDNDVIRVGDTYYMVSTTMFFSPGAPIMKSKDLMSWEMCSYVYDTYADGDVQNLRGGKHDYAHGQWAASLRYHDGMFYVFFGSYGSGKSYIYKTDDIEHGSWTRSEISGMYHDASILFDDDGRNYLVYGGGGEIKIKELNAEMTGFKWGGTDKTLFKTGLTGLAGEGSHVQKIGDYYYVFVIAWPNGSGRIELCYRSKDLLGNYEGKTVLNSGLGTYGSGVAQGGIVDTPDGKWYGMLFQDHGSVGRIPVLVPVTWQDNWPIMGVNGKAPVTLDAGSSYTGSALAKDDDFSYSDNKLQLEWQWNHNPDNKSWSVTERDGWLRLKNNNIATNLLNARNTLTMRTEGPACSSVIKLDTKGMKAGDYAGLSAFQFNYGNVGVYVSGNGEKKIYMANNGGYSGNSAITDSRDNIVEETPLNGDEVYLRLEFKFNNVDSGFNVSNNIDRVNFFYSYDGSNWTKIGKELGMTYDLKMFTGYRSAIYSYPTRSTGGYADIDFFDYERDEWNTPVSVGPNDEGYFFRSDFEKDRGIWSGRGSAKVAVSSDASFAGKSSLFVSGREAAWNGTSAALGGDFAPGESYSFSADVMFPEGTLSDTFFMKLQYVDSDDTTHYDTVAEGTALRGNWIQLENTDFCIPDDASDIFLYLETQNSTNSFYADNITAALPGIHTSGADAGVSVIPGDLTGDSIVNAFDAVRGRIGLSSGIDDPAELAAADVNRDGEFTIADLIQLEHFLLSGRFADTDDTDT